jgi:hypothetical protein
LVEFVTLPLIAQPPPLYWHDVSDTSLRATGSFVTVSRGSVGTLVGDSSIVIPGLVIALVLGGLFDALVLFEHPANIKVALRAHPMEIAPRTVALSLFIVVVQFSPEVHLAG